MKQKQNIKTVILNLIQDLQRLLLALLNDVRGRCQIKFGMTSLYNNSGFTLIELLVVVLIIGILAAVAVPQYQKAVEKSRASEAISLLKSVYQAAQAYYLANGVWPTSVSQIAIDIPWTGTANWRSLGDFKQGISNKYWSLQFVEPMDASKGISMGRISGKYKGTGFLIYFKAPYSNIKSGEILCIEKGADQYVLTPNSAINNYYCPHILNGSQIPTVGSLYFYRLP